MWISPAEPHLWGLANPAACMQGEKRPAGEAGMWSIRDELLEILHSFSTRFSTIPDVGAPLGKSPDMGVHNSNN